MPDDLISPSTMSVASRIPPVSDAVLVHAKKVDAVCAKLRVAQARANRIEEAYPGNQFGDLLPHIDKRVPLLRDADVADGERIFREDLADISRCAEPSIARQRLEWWDRETLRLYKLEVESGYAEACKEIEGLLDELGEAESEFAGIEATSLSGVLRRLEYAAENGTGSVAGGPQYPWQFALLGAIGDLRRIAGAAPERPTNQEGAPCR